MALVIGKVMDHHFIIELLREKEASLLNELQNVRITLEGFLKENSEALFSPDKNYGFVAELIPLTYEACNTYNAKIMFILAKFAKPMLVDEIVQEIITIEPVLDFKKLHNTIGYSLSILARSNRVKKHPFNRQIKYSL